MRIFFLTILPIFLSAGVYKARIEPLDKITIKSEVSGSDGAVRIWITPTGTTGSQRIIGLARHSTNTWRLLVCAIT